MPTASLSEGLSYSNAPPPQPRCWGWGAVTSPNSFLLRRTIWKPTRPPHPALPQPGGSQLRPRAGQVPVQASLSAEQNLQECLPRSPCCPAGPPTPQPAAFPPFTVLNETLSRSYHSCGSQGKNAAGACHSFLQPLGHLMTAAES